MANYNTKYFSNFASQLGVTGTIYFNKLNYAGGTSEQIKLVTGGLEINYNWKDWFNPIIGQNCSMTLINDASDYFTYDDLYAPDDYEWQIIVDVSNNDGDSVEIFNGFLNPEPMDARYLKNSAFRLTASGYLNKLEEVPPDILESATNTDNHTIIDFILSGIRETQRDASVYVNMTLEPSGNLAGEVSNTFGAWQKTGVSPEAFFKDMYDKDGTVDVLNKILKPFNSYMYSWDGDWYVERFNDLNPANKYWRKYNSTVEYGTDTPCEYILQNDPSYLITDFDQTGYSQNLKVETSFSKFTVKKNIDEWSNLTNNYFDYDHGNLDYPAFCNDTDVGNYYTQALPKLRKWNVYSSAADSFQSYNWPAASVSIPNGFISNRRGPRYPRYGISNTIQKFGWPSSDPNYAALLSTRFLATVDPMDIDASGNVGGNTLNISFKYMPLFGVANKEEKDIYVRFYWFLRDYVPGATSNYWIVRDEDDNWSRLIKATGSTSLDNVNTEYLSIDGATKLGKVATDFNVEIPLSQVTGLPSGDRQFIFGIMAERWSDEGQDGTYHLASSSMLGDFVITVDGDADEDTVSGTINGTNLKNEVSVDIDIFDVTTLNTPSAIVGGDDLATKTSLWCDVDSSSYSIVEHLIRDRFKLYNQKRRQITTNLRTDKFLKPFSIFYDDQDPFMRKYVLGSYSYTPDKDQYKVTLKEWDNTDIDLTATYGGRYNDGQSRPGTLRDPKDYTGRGRGGRGGRGGRRGSGRGGADTSNRPTRTTATGTRRTRSTYTSTGRVAEPVPMYTSGDQTLFGRKVFRESLRTESGLLIGTQTASLSLSDDGSTFFIQNKTPGEWTYFNNHTAGDVSTNIMGLNATKGIEMYKDVSVGADLYLNSLPEASTNQILFYDSITKKVTFADASIGGGGTTINELDDIGDVSVTGATLNQVLTWKGTYWEPEDVSGTSFIDKLSDVGDVSLNVEPSIGAILLYQDGSVWEDSNPVDGSLYFVQGIGNLGTVDVTSISAAQDGSALVYDATGSKWTYGVAGGSDVTNLDDLGDVSITSPASNNIIRYDGADWVNSATISAETYLQERLSNATKSSGSSGTAGDWSYDSSYLYICIFANTWKKLTLENI